MNGTSREDGLVLKYLTCISEKKFARLTTGHACYLMGPLCTCTPFQCCRFGKPPSLLPENKMADGCHKKELQPEEKAGFQENEKHLCWCLIISAARLHSFDLSQGSTARQKINTSLCCLITIPMENGPNQTTQLFITRSIV